MQVFLAENVEDFPDDISLSAFPILVFHSAVATFLAPSDQSGIHGMRRERIHSTPSWRRGQGRHDCAFVVEDEGKAGMSGMRIVRVLLFFSIEYNQEKYPCAFVEWFETVKLDSVTGLWLVCPEYTDGSRDKSVLHLDTFLRAAHLIPVYGGQQIPLDFHFSKSLDFFEAYYVNKYIDHHAFEIAI
jgi:hypothetical protein